MNKSFAAVLSFFIASLSFAETVKLKDGSFISGSITSQTEYTLNVTTSYGPVIINQREVEAILPDKHRVYLKGGTQLVGVIVDLDEFNLKLQTDEGVVNIDMPQIVSVEVYDYEQGEQAQQAVQQRQAAQQEQATRLSAAQTPSENTINTPPTVAPSVSAEGGLTFDADIEKVFDAKKPEIVNGQVQTVREISAAEIRAKRAEQMSDEEAFLKGVTNQTANEQTIAQTAEAARSGKLDKIKQSQAKKAKRPKDSNTNKYFAITVGAQMNDLKLNNTERAGFEGTDNYDVGGTAVRAEAAFLWRLKNSNLWLGPALAIANIPKNSFKDLDPAVIDGNNTSMATFGYLAYDPDVTTSGQMIDVLLKANYYFNPDHLFSIYLTGSGGYRMLRLNYHGGIQGETLSSDSVIGSVGLGVETHVDDLMLGLEVQEFFTPYSGDFKDSSAANTVLSAKFSWKF